MPRQNRVDPFGRIVAHPGYGLLMGNRGCLHDAEGRIVRSSARTAWISCVPAWPGVRRQLATPGAYTELFFLDEATALAAGHRPCGFCRPAALTEFKRAWLEAHRLDSLPLVNSMDSALRASAPHIGRHIEDLPDGAIINADGRPLMRWNHQWRPWSFDGYADPTVLKTADVPTLITPAPIMRVLQAGYRPLAHPTASA